MGTIYVNGTKNDSWRQDAYNCQLPGGISVWWQYHQGEPTDINCSMYIFMYGYSGPGWACLYGDINTPSHSGLSSEYTVLLVDDGCGVSAVWQAFKFQVADANNVRMI